MNKWKMQNVKLTNQFWNYENAEHENDGALSAP